MNVLSPFIESVKKFPDRPALIAKNESCSYSSLLTEVAELAQYYRNRGIGSGDRVMVFKPISIDLYKTVLALFYLGAVVVFLDEWVSFNRLNLCCKKAECKAFISGFKIRWLSVLSKELRKIPIKISKSKKLPSRLSITDVNEDSPALITFTTGSTGEPKAAIRSHGFLLKQFEILGKVLNPQPNEVSLTTLPIVLLLNLGSGTTSIIPDFNPSKPTKFNPESILNQILQYKVNSLITSPYYLERLADFVKTSRLPPIGLNKIFVGGGAVTHSLAEKVSDKFPEATCIGVYGSTECEPISLVNFQELKKVNSEEEGLLVGEIHKSVQLKIISAHHQLGFDENESSLKSETLNEAEIGEVIVSGQSVLDSYFRSNSAFEKTKMWVNNVLWHKTGDMGYIKNNQLFLTGRTNQIVRNKSQQVQSIFYAERVIQKKYPNKRGTLLDLSSEVILVIEKGIENPESFKNQLDFDKVVCLQQIPLDKRHHSKIDIEQLKELLHNKNLL